MTIENLAGEICSISGLTIILADPRSGEKVGVKGIIHGGGDLARDLTFSFKNVYEIDSLIDILIRTRKSLTIQDCPHPPHSYHSGLCDNSGNPTLDEDIDSLFQQAEQGITHKPK